MKYDFLFEDGSLFSVPSGWRDVYERYFGATEPVELEARLRFVVGKYWAHRAMPSKFDGVGCEEEGDAKYDDPEYYVERWDDPASWEYRGEPPSMAEVAEQVLYHSMRSGLMQQALDEYAAERGTKPVRVLTPEELLQELEWDHPGEG
jgi:hypothetical protein